MEGIVNGGLSSEQIQQGLGVDPHAVGSTRLREIVAYGRKVYDLGDLLCGVRDTREDPRIASSMVATITFFCGLLRIRSFNALEPKLCEKTFVRLVDAPLDSERLCSADTLGRAARRMELESVRSISDGIIAQAERNKVFREGWRGAMRYVALDGWEPICSEKRHCPKCLVRWLSRKQSDGRILKVPQYYHRYVVAMLIDDRFDLALDIEPLLRRDLRAHGAGDRDEDEGELTAAKRLLRRVKATFNWLDAVVADGLYANGPFLSLVTELRMGAVIIARKENDEPLREAFNIWGEQPPSQVIDDREAHERIAVWDCPEIQTLSSYNGPIRVVRALVTDTNAPDAPTKTWCMLVIGKANKLAPVHVLSVARGRWHIENTGFHQWTTRWHFSHVFVHDGHAILAIYWLFLAAYNLLTLFLYRQLRCYGRDRGNDPTRTISRLIDEMLDDLARLTCSPWDTS